MAYLTQTTLSLAEARDIIHALKLKFPNIAGPHSQDICYATENRQVAVRNLTVRAVAPESVQALGALAARSMQLQCTIQEGHIWFSDANATVAVEMRDVFASERGAP